MKMNGKYDKISRTTGYLSQQFRKYSITQHWISFLLPLIFYLFYQL